MKIDFEFTTDKGVFKDCIILDDSHELTESQIESMKHTRLNNWLYSITNSDTIESSAQEDLTQ